MATWEMQLISRIIRTGDLTSVLEWGISDQDFLTMEGNAMFRHLVGYHSVPEHAGSVLGENGARHYYPNFVFCDDASMTTEAICSEVRKARQTLELKHFLQKAIDMADGDPYKAASYAQECSLHSLALGNRNRDLKMTSAINTIVDQYNMKKSGMAPVYAKWPWHVMNDQAGPFEKGDYIVFYGRPKSMKSWVLAYLISWIFNLGKRAIVYTKEMTGMNIFSRVVACIAQVRYQEFRVGRLLPHEEHSLYSAQRMLNVMQQTEQLIALDASDEEGNDTVPWLRSKVDAYKPDFVFVDGLYLMTDIHHAKKDNQRVQNISRALRQMALNTGVPVIGTLQANRAAAKNDDANLDEIAFSDAIGQDATQIFRVINEKDKPTIALVVGGAREFKLNGFRINGQPAYDFSYFGPLTAKEIQKAKEKDKGDEDDAEAHAKANNKKTAAKPAMTEARAVADLNKRIDQSI